MIPKLSSPLTKLIRTGEGILLYAFNVVMVLLPVLGDLPFAKTLPWLAITNAVAFASRTLLKAVAVGKPLVGGDPIAVAASVTGPIDQALAQIVALDTAQGTIQAAPGAPAETVTAGLAPTSPPAAA